jgi:Uncharacterized protein SCO1/SenC/PrrC, involved in biogenesis of respiratory and photosynthetic systems
MHHLKNPLAGLLALLLVACAPSSRHWHLTNVTHIVSSLQFRMPSTAGGVQTQADYRGDVVMLYFGYTNCPDVCPTTLAKLAGSIRQLGPEGKKVRVLFVTVDPKRDTLAVLKRYVDAFDPKHFVGLRPGHAELDHLVKRYRVAYSYDKPDKNGNYVVNHSAAVFIFGPMVRPACSARKPRRKPTTSTTCGSS